MKLFKTWREPQPSGRVLKIADPHRAATAIPRAFLGTLKTQIRRPTVQKPNALRLREAKKISKISVLKESSKTKIKDLPPGSKVAPFVQHVDKQTGAITDLFDLAFSSPAGANAYYTPAQSQTMRRHWDAHDVYLFQIEGRKLWQISKPAEKNPLAFGFGPETPVVLETILEPGSILFIPRGYQHVGIALEDASFHVTFGLYRVDRRKLVNQEHATIHLASLLTDESHRSFHSLKRAFPKGQTFKRSRTRFVVIENGERARVFTSRHELELNESELAEFKRLIRKKRLRAHPMLKALWQLHLIERA